MSQLHHTARHKLVTAARLSAVRNDRDRPLSGVRSAEPLVRQADVSRDCLKFTGVLSSFFFFFAGTRHSAAAQITAIKCVSAVRS